MIELLFLIPITIITTSLLYIKHPHKTKVKTIRQQFRLPEPEYHHKEYHDMITRIINTTP